MAKLSRAIKINTIAVARCDTFAMTSWEASFRRSRFNTTSHKMLSMGTRICNHFERLVYIESNPDDRHNAELSKEAEEAQVVLCFLCLFVVGVTLFELGKLSGQSSAKVRRHVLFLTGEQSVLCRV